jgi:hypothetical protein
MAATATDVVMKDSGAKKAPIELKKWNAVALWSWGLVFLIFVFFFSSFSLTTNYNCITQRWKSKTVPFVEQI